MSPPHVKAKISLETKQELNADFKAKMLANWMSTEKGIATKEDETKA